MVQKDTDVSPHKTKQTTGYMEWTKKFLIFANLQAVCEARTIGSSCPGYCLATLD